MFPNIYEKKYVRGVSSLSARFFCRNKTKGTKTLRATDEGVRSSLQPRHRRSAVQIKRGKHLELCLEVLAFVLLRLRINKYCALVASVAAQSSADCCHLGCTLALRYDRSDEDD